MVHIAIVEDTKAEREFLETCTRNYLEASGQEAVIRTFESGSSFLENYPESLDLVLLDIEMPELSGMDTARRIRTFDRGVQILFVTYLVQYAIEGYSVDAADFIPKPVSYRSFSVRMDRVMEKIRILTPRYLMTSYARTPVSCQIQLISYIESLNKKTIIHLSDGGMYYSSEPLYALEEKLSGEAFFRCHNAFLVNLNQVRSVKAGLAIVSGREIPVSKYRKKDFLERLALCRGGIF